VVLARLLRAPRERERTPDLDRGMADSSSPDSSSRRADETEETHLRDRVKGVTLTFALPCHDYPAAKLAPSAGSASASLPTGNGGSSMPSRRVARSWNLLGRRPV